LGAISALQQLCTHPAVVGKESLLQQTAENILSQSNKARLLVPLLAKLKSEGHRVLIFSQRRRELDCIEVLIRNKYKYCRIDGKVRVDTM
jgi:SNF2 family DNA or RNA helicase